MEVGKQEITGTDGPVGGEKSEKIGEQNNAPLSQDNVGSRLLRLMGWEQGQGLGKEGQGITNPIRYLVDTQKYYLMATDE